MLPLMNHLRCPSCGLFQNYGDWCGHQLVFLLKVEVL